MSRLLVIACDIGGQMTHGTWRKMASAKALGTPVTKSHNARGEWSTSRPAPSRLRVAEMLWWLFADKSQISTQVIDEPYTSALLMLENIVNVVDADVAWWSFVHNAPESPYIAWPREFNVSLIEGLRARGPGDWSSFMHLCFGARNIVRKYAEKYDHGDILLVNRGPIDQLEKGMIDFLIGNANDWGFRWHTVPTVFDMRFDRYQYLYMDRLAKASRGTVWYKDTDSPFEWDHLPGFALPIVEVIESNRIPLARPTV